MADEAPLRILVITSRPMIDQRGNPIHLLDVEKERRRIADGLKKSGIAARAHFLAEATTSASQDALRDEWDVIHYTGHGTADGCLVLENGTGVAHLLTREETAKLFAAHSLHLVILSACYSETAGRALLDAGVPSVIAIDAATPIADYAAILFAEHFYKAMARGWTIQRSFNDAKQSVALDAKVGDKDPPLDRSGQAEAPWSKRFTLLGDGSRRMTVSEGEYRESDGRIQTNLRRDENFVGRAREISDVAKAFDDGRPSRVTLWGPGGVGKTALSQAVAWWHIEREKVGAALWASAGRDERQYRLRDLASLLAIASRSFQLPVTEQSNFEEQKRAVREFLESRDAILILDNWETIETDNKIDLWDFVLSLSNRVRVLVTSRDVLPAKDARNIALQPLVMDDAVKLFAQVARNAGYFDRNPNLSEEDIDIRYAICKRLSGYALAVQVAAGQTVSRTLGEIWKDLQQYPKNVLEGIDELTGEPRGVWTSLDLSYNACNENEKAMFRRMSVFLAPASADDVAAVTEVSRPSLDVLVRRSLAQMREGLYSLLPVMRMYADDELKEAGEDPRPLHLRAANYYGQQGTLESAVKLSGHLFELASRYEWREAAEEFARFVPGFYDDLVTRGDWTEARRKAEQLLRVARLLGNRDLELYSTANLANMLCRVGEYERASELHRETKKASEDADSKSGIAITLHQMGKVEQSQGHYHQAMRLYEESLRRQKELGSKSGIAGTLGQMGMIKQSQGHYHQAMRLYKESMRCAKKLDNKSDTAIALHQMGTVAQDKCKYAQAMRLYEKSLMLRENLHDKNGIAETLGRMGMLAAKQENLKEALSYFISALITFEQLHSPYRNLARKDIARVRAKAGDEQFAAWLRELSIDDDLRGELLEQIESDGEWKAQELLKSMTTIAQIVVKTRAQAKADEISALNDQMSQTENDWRKQGGEEDADFIAALQTLLAGEDAGEKIAALVEPLKQIAERARDEINEGGE